MHQSNTERDGKPPYSVVLIDTWDAVIEADVFEQDRYQLIAGKFDSLRKAITLADGIYITKNYLWDSFNHMQTDDGGWDVRIYDANNHCMYKAYQSFKNDWIKPWREKIWVDKFINSKEGN